MPTSSPHFSDEPLTRRAGAWAFVALLALSFFSAPGKVVADTKLDLTANPIGFLARAANVWSSQSPLGQVQNQAYGYFFPHGAFFALGQFLHVPPWITQRLWWALLLFAGFWGIIRLAEALRTGSRGSRVVAAAAFVLAPQVLTTLGAISSETAPVMLAPWVLLPLVQLLQGADVPLRNLAARSAVAVALMGAVNAVATGFACAVAALWWLLHVRFGAGTRRFWTFSAWWAVCVALATTWWIVPLLIMGRVSPPFLEFIESSRATTQWASVPEVLRGTTSWSPFISDERGAGAMLTTSPAAVVVTGLVACAGIAGLTMRRMPKRGVWATVLLVGLAGIGAGYASGLGSPFAEPVRVFLDSVGAPLRNVYKLEPFLRLPLVLGMAHLLARAPLPGTVGLAKVRRALAHPEQDRLAAGALAVVVVLALAGGMAWTGKLAPRGPYDKIPDYWSQAADWLSAHAAGTAPGQARAERALVVPGAPFGAQLWGLTRDEPIQPLAETPWAVRDAIPLNPPGAIRALDSVQRLFSAGTPSAGLAATLRRQGISYLVLRADLDPGTSRSARPALARAAIIGSPGISEVARFGADIAPPTVEKVVVDSGLRPPLPAITIYRVDGAAPTGPYVADLASMPRVAGGPEALLGLQADAAASGRRELGAALLASDAKDAGLPDGPLTVTDTPKRRETDYGRVDDHSSAIRTASDPRRTLNRLPDYPAAGLVDGTWQGATVSASSSAADATQLGTVLPGAGTAAAVDGDKNTAWVSSGLDHAINQWMQFTLPEPRADLSVTVTVGRALGPAVTRLLITTEAGTVYSDPVTAGTPITLVAPSEPTRWVRITAAETADRTWGNQFAITEAELADTRSGTTIPARHDVALPASGPAQRWVFGQDTMGRSGCVVTPGENGAPGPVQCADIAIGPEEPGPLRRTVDGPGAPAVTPSLTVRARPGQALSALLGAPGAPSAFAESAVGDGRASSAAAVDGDPNTVWSAPQSVTEPTSPKPVLRLRLPSPQVVGGLTLRLPRGEAPARPTRIGVDLGTGRQVRELPAGDSVTVKVDPAVTDSISISLLDWDERININDFGFPEKMAPGLAEVRAVGPDGAPVPGSEPAPADRPVVVPCETGPTVRIGDRVLRFRIEAGARELRDGAPIRAVACDPAPVPLPAGKAQVVATPGLAFSVDSLALDTPAAAEASPRDESVKVQSWTPDRRVVTVSRADADQVLVVPESRNSGWAATGPDGAPLKAVTVNGWQQGWVVPQGTDGAVTLRYALNAPYRIGLFGGLALLAILAALALVPGSRPRGSGGPVRAWQPGIAAGLGIGAVAFVLSGWPGLALWAASGLATWVVSGLHVSADRRAALRVFGSAGFVLAGMLLLATGPWHAEAGYVGHGPWPQGLALVGVLLMAWSTVPPVRLLHRRGGGAPAADGDDGTGEATD
ncbi:alpha-(1-_3)-arabinofuranosyltransferase [Tsukamurella tyrosinosolvens]|uniref:alpha-(1->3)-arabinofuranosyltransferase n=1 Tax=Tsukamurella tyrosinosolvens TaxID=57704 RepID=UPI002DD43164|nr:alpha-(1->3)-arabinofuranosyltransferase [Tsukamurella tyrosinosolvens]MEC4615998.1 alpha-(1->3)-arabinofuranosyltransferase [Tsukamurella tyrosinosolvens]